MPCCLSLFIGSMAWPCGMGRGHVCPCSSPLPRTSSHAPDFSEAVPHFPPHITRACACLDRVLCCVCRLRMPAPVPCAHASACALRACQRPCLARMPAPLPRAHASALARTHARLPRESSPVPCIFHKLALPSPSIWPCHRLAESSHRLHACPTGAMRLSVALRLTKAALPSLKSALSRLNAMPIVQPLRTASESRTCRAKPVPSWHDTADIRQGENLPMVENLCATYLNSLINLHDTEASLSGTGNCTRQGMAWCHRVWHDL
ncbi:hypothetical protein HAX54_047921 [Datura stramonium]|uniref:Uncharacterized protein n=1 Tax=Datura stramonium TaxID=4076 RepID=A0ABS8SUK8_DATST|nr:hypothetical protein [Datura stramonium]